MTLMQPRDDSPEERQRRSALVAASSPPTPEGYTAAQAVHLAHFRRFEAWERMTADSPSLAPKVATQTVTLLDRARRATGPRLLDVLAWPAPTLGVTLLAQVPPPERADLSTEAVPWRFGKREARPALHDGGLAATGREVPARPRRTFALLTDGTSPAACERAALTLMEDVARLHDLLDAWDRLRGDYEPLPRPTWGMWTSPDYEAALRAVGVTADTRDRLTLLELLHVLRDRVSASMPPAEFPAHGVKAAPGALPAAEPPPVTVDALPPRWLPPQAPAGLHVLKPDVVAAVVAKARALEYLNDDGRFKSHRDDGRRNREAALVAVLRYMTDIGAIYQSGSPDVLAMWTRASRWSAAVCKAPEAY